MQPISRYLNMIILYRYRARYVPGRIEYT